jgi:SAM-dependent methyltransferase
MIDLATMAVNLEQTSEGTWRCKSASSVSYPEWGNEACFQVEDVSFWFQHRNACIFEAMKQYPPSGPVFDIGGGNGFVAKGMQDVGFEVVLLEPGAAGCRNAQRRGIQNVICAGLEDAGFEHASMAAVGLFDVIEHIAEDRKFMEMVGSYLCSNGRVYLTVPAYQALWSHEDIDARHFRRYSRQAVSDLLKNAGFAVEFLTGLFWFLPPAILAARVIPYRLGAAKTAAHEVNEKLRAQHEVRSALVSRPLRWLLRQELAHIRARREASFGGSWLAVARRI